MTEKTNYIIITQDKQIFGVDEIDEMTRFWESRGLLDIVNLGEVDSLERWETLEEEK